jgi:Trm5-related predicted tRNA methylase
MKKYISHSQDIKEEGNDMTTGHYITTRVINKIIAEQTEYITVTRPAPLEIKDGITIYGTSTKERIPVQKELVTSLEKCREYIHNKYLNIELTKTQVEDIFRYLCSDMNWRIIINNKIEYELLNKIIIDLVIPIEEMTDSKGIYAKIIGELENQNLFPNVQTPDK